MSATHLIDEALQFLEDALSSEHEGTQSVSLAV